jgi:hypothetical protein
MLCFHFQTIYEHKFCDFWDRKIESIKDNKQKLEFLIYYYQHMNKIMTLILQSFQFARGILVDKFISGGSIHHAFQMILLAKSR